MVFSPQSNVPSAQINAPHILWLLRKGKARDWATLCDALDVARDPHRFSSYEPSKALARIRGHLDALRAAGLIDFDNRDAGLFGFSGPIEVSKNIRKIQEALGISLQTLARLADSRSMVVQPYFGRPEGRPATSIDVFTVMPFREELTTVYRNHIAPVCRKLGLTIRRADDFFSDKAVVSDIWTGLCTARAVIADCTGRNPNVFYEIGLCHVVGKPTILITQNEKDVPFDLQHLRFIRYQTTSDGVKELEISLREALQNLGIVANPPEHGKGTVGDDSSKSD